MLLKPFARYILLLASAVALSITTVIFGALPLLATRRIYGRLPYWAGTTLVSGCLAMFVFSSYGLLLFSLAVLVGVYVEIEDHGGSVFTSGLVSTVAAIGTTAFGVGLWFYRTHGRLVEEARQAIEPLVGKIATMNPGAGVSVDTVLQQLPSGIIIGYVIALAIALMGHNRLRDKLARWIPEKQHGPIDRLAGFRAPDVLIWLTIAAVFGAFFKHGNATVEIVSINVLNVLVVVFFFQGLAIVSHAFRVFKVGPVWQTLWYVLFVLQLFLIVSLLGFADFWLEFRDKLARKVAENQKGFQK